MKILLATSSVTPNAGIPSYNREVCAMLSKEHEMHLLVDEDVKQYPGYSKVTTLAGINQSSFNECVRLLSEINAESYDLIINSNSHIMARLVPFVNDKTKVITVSHSLRYTDSDNAAFNNRYIDHIVALSGYNKEYMERKFHIKNKIHVIYNFVADDLDNNAIRERKKKNETLKIVYAGGTAPSKCPEIVLGVIRILKATNYPFEFYWMGIKTPPFKRFQPFDDVSVLVPEDERIVFTGKIPRDQASKLIGESNIFFAPSRREGCPMALLEAMRIGTIPIVADYKIANREIIEDGVNGFVIDHNNVKAFADKMVEIITHHQDYWYIYEKSRKTYIEGLAFNTWKRKMSALINDSSSKHKRRKAKMTKFSFLFNILRFNTMHVWNLCQMIYLEILPSALPIYKMYKSSTK